MAVGVDLALGPGAVLFGGGEEDKKGQTLRDYTATTGRDLEKDLASMQAMQVQSQQISHCIAQWLTARRLPQVSGLPVFTVDDIKAAGERLVKASAMLSLRNDVAGPASQIEPKLLDPLPMLAIPYLRVLAEAKPTFSIALV